MGECTWCSVAHFVFRREDGEFDQEIEWIAGVEVGSCLGRMIESEFGIQ